MNCVSLIINLAVNNFDKTYTYIVPDKLKDEIEFGKRVLVDFGGRKTEGYIVERFESNNCEGMKEILKVVDEEAVLTPELLHLARWMADFYLCPISMALKLMVPKILNHKKSLVVIPSLKEDEVNEQFFTESESRLLLEKLWEHGELDMRTALKYGSKEKIENMEKEGLLLISGKYKAGKHFNESYAYVPVNFNPEDMEALRKKAPRQAEAMEILGRLGEVNVDILHKAVPLASIKSLINKGYISMRKKSRSEAIQSPFELSKEQEFAIERLNTAICQREYSEFLLYGITGSGKTEVYLKAAETAIENGLGVIVLVPEIALTRQLVDIFTRRITNVAVLHSGMSAGERYDEWKRIKQGEVRLVLGARSAIFAPIPAPGLIIIDEEQENSFKQEDTPRYHAREVARERAHMESAVLLMGSATPSLETFYDAMQGRSELLSLKKRVGGGSIPQVTIEDMRKSFKTANSIISLTLEQKINEKLQKGQQIILFINRRGYSPMTICRECGNISSCPFCSVTLTYHRDIGKNICHYCNYQESIKSKCSQCGSSYLQLLGSGTQKVEEEVRQLFPDARIERMDLDSSRRKGVQKSILERMKDGSIDILIGTQMVAKGLDFPEVSLVGIVDADSILNLPDFRAGERCFQLLVQSAGRAGRSNMDGEVVIQTFNPDNPVIQMAAEQNYMKFYTHEITLRRSLFYPPFTSILRIVFNTDQEELCKNLSRNVAEYIEEIIDAREEEIMILGPAPCPIYRLRNRFRYQIIIKSEQDLLLRSIAENLLNTVKPQGGRMEIDINPVITM